MEYQRENEVSFKSVKNHFKVHTYQKGGCALGFVASMLPFSHILHQVTSTVTTAGAAGLIEKGINTYNKKKMV